MKKGSRILLVIFACSLFLVVGVFIGRNTGTQRIPLPVSYRADSESGSETNTTDYRLDINTASKSQLMDLPGIGETLAERILVYRQTNGAFQAPDDLMNIEGIGQKKFLQIEALIKVGG